MGPLPHASQRAGGKAHRLLWPVVRGGAAVVVAGVTTRRGVRESRTQGQGRQRDLREVLALAVHVSSSGEASGATARRAACRKRRR